MIFFKKKNILIFILLIFLQVSALIFHINAQSSSSGSGGGDNTSGSTSDSNHYSTSYPGLTTPDGKPASRVETWTDEDGNLVELYTFKDGSTEEHIYRDQKDQCNAQISCNEAYVFGVEDGVDCGEGCTVQVNTITVHLNIDSEPKNNDTDTGDDIEITWDEDEDEDEDGHESIGSDEAVEQVIQKTMPFKIVNNDKVEEKTEETEELVIIIIMPQDDQVEIPDNEDALIDKYIRLDELNLENYQEKAKEDGDPVKISTGTLVDSMIDLGYNNVGNDIGINRSYIGSSDIAGSFGKKWLFNYDTKVIRGLGLSTLKGMSETLSIYKTYISNLNKCKSTLEESMKDFYLSWRNLYSGYKKIIELHNYIKKSKELSEAAWYWLPKEYRNMTTVAIPDDLDPDGPYYNSSMPIHPEAYYNKYELRLGDVNEDEKVDISDSIKILQHMFGLKPSGFNEKAADVNRDAKINVLDVVKVVAIYMGLEELEDEYITVYHSDLEKVLGITSWFQYIKSTFPVQLKDAIIQRYKYNRYGSSTAEIEEDDLEPSATVSQEGTTNSYNVDYDYDGAESFEEVAAMICENYALCKAAFDKVDKIMTEFNKALEKFVSKANITLKPLSVKWTVTDTYNNIMATCDKGIEVEGYLAEAEIVRSKIVDMKTEETALNKSNMLLNIFADDIPLWYQNIGCNKIILINEGGVPCIYEIEEKANLSSMEFYDFEGEETYIPDHYNSYDVMELKAVHKTDEKLYMLSGGGYLRITPDKKRYYYDLFGQLERIVDKNDNQVSFEYSYGLKSSSDPGEIDLETGIVYLVDKEVIIDKGESFQSQVYLNSGKYKLGSYTIEISYDPDVISVDTGVGSQGVSNGSISCIPNVSTDNEKGRILIVGYEVPGVNAGNAMHLFSINWKTVDTGNAYIDINVRTLSENTYETIGIAHGIGGRVVVKPANYSDQYVDITKRTRRLARIEDQYHRITSIERDSVTGLIRKITDPKERVVSYEYNGDNQLASVTDTDGDTISYFYENGLLKKTIKPDNSYIERFYRELNGKMVVDHARYENGGVEYFKYYPGEGIYKEGVVKGYSEYINPEGLLERTYYDEKLRTVRLEYEDGSHKDYEYDENDNMVKATDEEENVIECGYDERNNLVWMLTPNEDEDAVEDRVYQRWVYNESDYVTEYTDKMGNKTNYEYDAKGNLIGITYPNGTSVRTIRNARGQSEYSIDAKGNKTKIEYDQYGYPKRMINAIGVKKLESGDEAGALKNSTEIVSSIIGEIELIRDGDGNEVRCEIKDMGDTVEKRVIDAYGTTTTVFNNRKDCIKLIDKNGAETKFEYDKGHNVTKVIYPTGDIEEYKYRDDNKIEEKIIGGLSHFRYYYDERGRLGREEQVETGIKSEYKYNFRGNLSKSITNSGVEIEYYYTPGGKIKYIIDPVTQNTVYYKYNANGLLRSTIKKIGDRLLNESKYEYNNMGRVTRVIGADGIETLVEYDVNGNKKAIVENSNIAGYNYRTELEYDELNRLIRLIDPKGYTMSKSYNNLGLIESLKGKDGKKVKYQYDKLGRLIKEYFIRDENGNEVPVLLGSVLFNDAIGRDVTQVDELSKSSVNYKCDAMGRVNIFTDELGHKTDFEYNYLGKVEKIINNLGYETSFKYDALGRILQVTNANSESVEYNYDDINNEIRVKDGEGRIFVNKYDRYARLIMKNVLIKDEYGNENYLNDGYRYEYDEMGNLIKEIDENGKIYQYGYDNLGRLTSETNKTGGVKGVKWYTYFPLGGLKVNQSSMADFNGNVVTTTTDELDRVVEINDHEDKKTFEYYPDGSLKKAVNDNSDYNYEYDEFGAVKKIHEVKTDTTIGYEYDRLNKILKRKLYNGTDESNARLTEYRNDAEGKIKKIIDPDGNYTEFNYDVLDRLINEVRSNDINVEYVYDNIGRVTGIKNVKSSTNEVLSGVGYIYDIGGRIKYKVNEKGNVTGYKYDILGRLEEALYPFDSNKPIKDLEERVNMGYYIHDNNQSNAEKYVFNVTDPDFNDTNKDAIKNILGSKDEVKRSYLSLGQEEIVKWQINIGSDAIEFGSEINLTSDDEIKVRNLITSISNGKAWLDENQKMWKEVYQYDNRSNRIGKLNGWGRSRYAYSAGNSDGISRAHIKNFTYDANGNIIKESLGSLNVDYTYNNSNRMTNIRSDIKGLIGEAGNELAGGINYTYDVYGMRLSKELTSKDGTPIENKKNIYVYEGIDCIGDITYYTDENKYALTGETNRVGSRVINKTEFDEDQSKLGRISVVDKDYYYSDIQGSTMMKMKSEEIRCSVPSNEITKYTYDAFGNNYGDGFDMEEEYGYIGKMYTKSTGIVNPGYRDYLPHLGRFTTVDPIKDGDNWYTYCSNDPVNLIDPNGLEEILNPEVTPNPIHPEMLPGDEHNLGTPPEWFVYSNDPEKNSDAFGRWVDKHEGRGRAGKAYGEYNYRIDVMGKTAFHYYLYPENAPSEFAKETLNKNDPVYKGYIAYGNYSNLMEAVEYAIYCDEMGAIYSDPLMMEIVLAFTMGRSSMGGIKSRGFVQGVLIPAGTAGFFAGLSKALKTLYENDGDFKAFTEGQLQDILLCTLIATVIGPFARGSANQIKDFVRSNGTNAISITIRSGLYNLLPSIYYGAIKEQIRQIIKGGAIPKLIDLIIKNINPITLGADFSNRLIGGVFDANNWSENIKDVISKIYGGVVGNLAYYYVMDSKTDINVPTDEELMNIIIEIDTLMEGLTPEELGILDEFFRGIAKSDPNINGGCSGN